MLKTRFKHWNWGAILTNLAFVTLFSIMIILVNGRYEDDIKRLAPMSPVVTYFDEE